MNKIVKNFTSINRRFAILPYITYLKGADVEKTHEQDMETGDGKYSSHCKYFRMWVWGWLWFYGSKKLSGHVIG